MIATKDDMAITNRIDLIQEALQSLELQAQYYPKESYRRKKIRKLVAEIRVHLLYLQEKPFPSSNAS
jgi:hypothetical protein